MLLVSVSAVSVSGGGGGEAVMATHSVTDVAGFAVRFLLPPVFSSFLFFYNYR